MPIIQIEQAKVLRKYCEKLGREGVAKRIIELAEEIIKGEGAYQSTLRNAGKIKALCVGSKWDSYWDEKQYLGFQDMYWEANQKTHE